MRTRSDATMPLDFIKQLIAKGEGLTTEFKQSFDKEVIETIGAFANTKGGYVLVGIKDDGSVLGVNIGTESVQNYINQIKNSTEPSLIVDIEAIKIENKTILAIKVDEFPIKPISFKGKYFKRVYNSNHQMNLTEISNMHLQSLQLSWDAYEAQDTSMEDLDFDKIDRFFIKIKTSGKFQLSNDRVQNLLKLNLLKNNKPTNAAKLLFAKEQTIYNIHIGRFKTSTMIIDDKMLRLPLYEAVEETMHYIISHIKVAFEFTGAISRNEIFEYPKPALRELVLNAIIHRDYTSPIDIQIKIFDNKITLFNPGRLYGNMTIEKLSTDNYQAQTRNKLIAEAFYLTNDTEKYGSGYGRVRAEIASYPTMKLEYEEMGNGYLVTISYDKQKVSSDKNGAVNGAVNELLEFIKANPDLRANEICEKMKIPLRTAQRWIKQLKDEDKIVFKGSPKTGGYYAK